MRAFFLYPKPRGDRLREYRAGTGPGDAFHGLFHMSELGIEAEYDDNPRCALWRICQPLERLIASATGLGFSLAQSLRLLRRLRAADVVVTTADTSGLPVAFCKKLDLLGTPLAFISMGLTDSMRRLVGHPVFRWYRWMMSSIERVLVLGEAEREGFITLMGIPPERVHVVPFGVDTEFWHPVACGGSDGFLLSTGSDRARDYGTLVQAVGTDHRLRVVSRHSYFSGGELPANVTLHPDVTWTELREWHSCARAIVVPLHDVDQTSGQTSALQAMACGRPLIISAIRGTWDRSLRDGEHCIFVRPGDPLDLRRGIERVLGNNGLARQLGERARRYTEAGYNSRSYASALADQLRQAARLRR